MAEIAISIAEKLIEVIGSEIIKEICSMWNYKAELEELNKTIITIKNVLLDADSKRDDLTNVQKGYISELKDVVYDADDLFDEFRTLVELGEINGDKGDKFLKKVRHFFSQIGGHKGGTFLEKVRHFFSCGKGKLNQSRKMSRRVKKIKDHIDGIAKDYTRFGFNVDYKPIVRRREETCSYVDVKGIIGRDKDKDAIIELLRDPVGDDKGFCFLTIVGVGGVGKTALAQLVFNDDNIKSEFPSFRFWVCVSDQDGVEFDVKTILCKILEVVTKKNLDNGSPMELVQTQFREQFENKKYLLVLDDVWNESRINWEKLKKFLMIGASGSRIVVTSRSERTGNIIGNNHVYKLEGLSREDSQHLFEIAAFDGGEKDPKLVKIGENIVKKCCGTPLAIKVVGSLLYAQDISKWQSIERSGLNDIGKSNKDIYSILKLSYFNLTPSLKSCFSYCAIYPKDYILCKDMMIEYWTAQGFIIPLDGGQSIEDAAEEHFSILMRRCFFQDIEKDDYGNVKCFKIHDLMHDIAVEVGKEEFCVVSSQTRNLGEKVRHVLTSKNISLCSCKIRTCLFTGEEDWLDAEIENLTSLRVLGGARISRTLTDNIGKLLLLRYLSFEYNKGLEVLPNSVTRLYNLRTLILRWCSKLREVPNDFSNLINLRSLDMYGCEKLNKMPLGINKLTNLRDLTYYVTSNKIADEEFKVLQQVFSKLKGGLNVMYDSGSIQNLIKLGLFTPKKGEWVIHVADFEKLELSPYLKELRIEGYKGKVIPWLSNSFPQCLTSIRIKRCRSVEEISALSKIPHLKLLDLFDLEKVEYMENEISSSSNDTKFAEEFFPSLEELWIEDLPNLKQWWKGDFPAGVTLKFPHLSDLRIENCTELRSFAKCSNSQIMIDHHFPKLNCLKISNCCNLEMNLVCPTLEKLDLQDNINESFFRMGEMPKLREMRTNKVGHLKLIPPTNNCLTSLTLEKEIDVESAVECVQRWASSLQTLEFYNCKNMKRVPRLDHLIVLKKLRLLKNKELSISEEDEEPWKSMPKSLRHLALYKLPKMRRMPKGMQHLTFLQSLELYELHNMEGLPEWINCLSSLQSLYIYDCKGIKSLPESFKDLTSLKHLYILQCPDLEKRCKQPNGEDFYKIPKIKHWYTNR